MMNIEFLGRILFSGIFNISISLKVTFFRIILKSTVDSKLEYFVQIVWLSENNKTYRL